MNYEWSHWQIIKLDTPAWPEGTLYKVFACSHRDEWRYNSGIADYKEFENHVEFYGFSGSTYICPKSGMDQVHWSWQGILDRIMESAIHYGGSLISYEDFKKEFVKDETN